MGVAGNLIVESKGFCFFCLNQIIPLQSPGIKREQGLDPKSGTSYSLQSFSRYLKMNLKKVFNEEEEVFAQLLNKLEKSVLKVELCKDCADLVNSFSMLHLQLEKLEMEVVSILERISSKLAKCTAEPGTFLDPLIDADENNGWTGKLEVFNVLRTETISKCSQKLKDVQPRIRLSNLSKKEVTAKKVKCKRISSMNSVTQPHILPIPCPEGLQLEADIGNIKIERDFINSSKDEDYSFHSGDDRDSNSSSSFSDYEESATAPISEMKSGKVKPDISKLRLNEPSTSPQSGQVTVGRDKRNETDSVVKKYAFEILTPKKSSGFSKNRGKGTFDPRSRKYKCDYCLAKFKCKSSVLRHYQSIHLQLKYRCTLCGETFSMKSSYMSHHHVVHMGLRKFQCKACGKLFPYKKNLKEHQLSRTACGRDTKTFPFHCHLCSQGFTLNRSLTTHLNEIHFPSLGQFECEICRNTFGSKRYLNNHKSKVHRVT